MATRFLSQALVDMRTSHPRLLRDAGQTRVAKAYDIAGSGMIDSLAPHRFSVRSQSNMRGAYVVDRQAGTCSCPDFEHAPKRACKHRLAVFLFVRAAELQAAFARESASAFQDMTPADVHGIWDYDGSRWSHRCADGYTGAFVADAHAFFAVCSRCGECAADAVEEVTA